MLQFVGVYTNLCRNGSLTELEDWSTLTGRNNSDRVKLETPTFSFTFYHEYVLDEICGKGFELTLKPPIVLSVVRFSDAPKISSVYSITTINISLGYFTLFKFKGKRERVGFYGHLFKPQNNVLFVNLRTDTKLNVHPIETVTVILSLSSTHYTTCLSLEYGLV